MRVGLISERYSNEGGVGPERYSWELRKGLAEMSYGVCDVESRPSARRFALALNALSKVPLETLSLLPRVDILHATDPSSALALPLCGKKSVVTFHDLMPLRYTGRQFSMGDRVFSTFVYRLSVLCDAMIAVSEQTKSELIQGLGVSDRRVRVVNPGVSKAFRPIPSLKGNGPVVGYVGSLNARKRVEYLIRGFHLLRTRHHSSAKLVIVGRGDELPNLKILASSLQVEDAVTFLSGVTDARLNELYNQMSVLVIPSDYEGFGFPIVEAQTCGTPVVIRKDALITPEVASGCVKVSTVEELADRLMGLLTDDRESREASEAGMRNAQRFSWSECVRQTAMVYASVLSS